MTKQFSHLKFNIFDRRCNRSRSRVFITLSLYHFCHCQLTDKLLNGAPIQDVKRCVEFQGLTAALTHKAHLHCGARRFRALHGAVAVQTQTKGVTVVSVS